MSQDNGASVPDRALVNEAPAGLHPAGFDPSREITAEQYAAMRKLIGPMIEAACAMPVAELVTAMKGFYATSETNCGWYYYGLRFAMPPLLATIGGFKEGYDEAWGVAPTTETGSAHIE